MPGIFARGHSVKPNYVTTVQGILIEDIARRHGTPLFLYDCDVMREKFTYLRSHLPRNIDIFYSLKANPNFGIYSELRNLGVHADVSSLAELEIAVRAGTPGSSIIFVGPGKSRREISRCIELDIFAIVAESFEEVRLISMIAVEAGKTARVALRINPNFKVKGTRLTMGGRASQFGIDEEVVFDDFHCFRNIPNVRWVGVQCYVGTRILDPSIVVENTKQILALAERFKDRFEIELEVVDLGGGLGVPYFDNETEIDVAALGDGMSQTLTPFVSRNPRTRIVMELGRYLVAHSGMLVTRVRYQKFSRGKEFLICDGGTNCHMAAVGVGSFVRRNFPLAKVAIQGEVHDEVGKLFHVAGPLCTPNDLLGEDVLLPKIDSGDCIAVLNSGAYGPTASPGLFISQGFPTEVLVRNGTEHVIRERDSTEDILSKHCQIVPQTSKDALDSHSSTRKCLYVTENIST